VLLGLATFADQQDRAVVSMGVLAALAVVPPPRVEQLLRDLESSGLVEQTETERPGSAAVRLLVPELLARPMALASELWAVG
jgi:DNA-binding IclR family transcriptional regulator